VEEDDDDTVKPLPDRLITELTAYRTLALRNALANDPAVAFQAVLHNFVLATFYRFSSSTGCLEIAIRTPTFPAQAPGLKESASAEAIDGRHDGWKARLPTQGARLIGVYDSQVAFGQSRVLLVWTRLIMPNGRSIVLERQQGADTEGYSGLKDDVDNHWGALFKAALLSTLLGVSSELGAGADTGNNGDVIRALRRGSIDSLNQTGGKVVQRNLNIQPTLTIRPGFPVRVSVNRDLALEPYKS